MAHDLLCVVSRTEYGLVDEFLRIRFVFDQTESTSAQKNLEKEIIAGVSVERYLESEIDAEGEDTSVDYAEAERERSDTPEDQIDE